MVQPSLILVTTCIHFWCCTSNGSLSKGGVALVLDSFFTSTASPTWIFDAFMPFFSSASAFIYIFFSQNPVVVAWFQLATSCRTCCQGTLQGLHSLEKSRNFRWSPWKVLKRLCKALKSFWFYFNFECSGQQSSEKLRLKGDSHKAFFVLCKN